MIRSERHAASEGRILERIPIRHGRMAVSPFTFHRGAANLMSADLARTPTLGAREQRCGDCHLLNFGGATIFVGLPVGGITEIAGQPFSMAVDAGYNVVRPEHTTAPRCLIGIELTVLFPVR